MSPLLDNGTPHIVVVDDQPTNLRRIAEILVPGFHVHPFSDGEGMLRYLERGGAADLFLLDVVMPKLSGYELCERLQLMPAREGVPVVFLTSLDTVEDEERGLKVGAVDFITKPFSPSIVIARVRNHISLSRALRAIRQQNDVLETTVAERTRDLAQRNQELLSLTAEVAAIQDVTIVAYTSLAETRDNETGEHIKRTQHFVRELAVALKDHPRFAAELTDRAIDLIYKSAPLHDIGKVGIPDHILLKPGKLTPEEFEIMKTHTTIGRDAIVRAEQNLEESSSFLRYAREIAYCHQEKWDGSGYPQNLRGDDIPIAARLMATADVYDALVSRRVYKPAYPHDQAIAIMREGRGQHFDPDVFDALLGRQEEFKRISRQFNKDLAIPE